MSYDLVKKPYKNCKHHLVILGAGASLATLPNGDKNNKKLPVMDNFIEVLNLSSLLKEAKLDTKSSNFEVIYNELFNKGRFNDLRQELESRIYEYFSNLELPEEPTIYDYLVLSLRKKDVIATFNWDPLLLQAYIRNGRFIKSLPHLLFLHGNVMIGVCDKDRFQGFRGNICPKCGNKLKQVKILYPIKDKDYGSNEYISTQWNLVEQCFKHSSLITIFGYGAPKSDFKAMQLFKSAWGKLEERELEEFEIIDIKDEEQVLDIWGDFIFSHHYQIVDSYFKSYIALTPRRSFEAYFERFLNAQFLDIHPLPEKVSFSQLWESVLELIKYEED